jgi:tape measure domain-containing protein
MATIFAKLDSSGVERGVKAAKDAFASAVNAVKGGASNMEKAMRRAGSSTGLLGRSMSALGRAARTAGGGMGRLGRGMLSLKGAVAGLSLGLLATQITQASDAMTNMEGRLKLVTETSEQAARAQGLLFDVAQRASVGFQGTVDLYTKLARSTKELGVSQDELVGVTDTISKALTVSGASAQAADAALLQLGQGIAAGALRGEELNSVMEQTPRLAQAIADGMGIGIGQLREYGQQGAITAEVVIGALQNAAAGVESEFQRMPDTVGKAMQRVRNDVLVAMAQVDTTPLSSAIEEIRTAAADSTIVSDLAGAVTQVFAWIAQGASYVIRNWHKVQAAGIAVVGSIIKGWNYMATAFAKVSAVITHAWDSTITGIKRGYASFIDGVAGLIDNLPGTSDLVASMRAYTSEVRSGAGDTGSLAEKLAGLEAQYKATAAEIDGNTHRAMQKVLTKTQDTAEAATELDKVLTGLKENGKVDIKLGGEKELEEARKEAEKFADTFAGLEDSLDPVKAAMRAYESDMATLNRALKDGLIDQARHFALAEAAGVRYAESLQQAAQDTDEAFARVEGFKNLERSLDPVKAASDDLSETLATLDAAVQYGATTQQRAAQLSALAWQQYSEDVRDALKEVDPVFARAAEIGEGMADAVVDNFAEVTKGNKTLKDALGDMAGDIANAIAEEQLWKPLKENLTNIFTDVLFESSQDAGSATGGLLGGLFSGGKSGGGFLGSIGSSLGGMFSSFIPSLGFASGGSFQIGGSGGADSQVVSFRGTPGETVTVSPKGAGGGGNVTVQMNVNGATDADSFMRSEGQISAMLARAVRDAQRNM